jgi:hypothetical protein
MTRTQSQHDAAHPIIVLETEPDSLGVFWLWLFVDRIIRATCSPFTTGMWISQMMTSNSANEMSTTAP